MIPGQVNDLMKVMREFGIGHAPQNEGGAARIAAKGLYCFMVVKQGLLLAGAVILMVLGVGSWAFDLFGAPGLYVTLPLGIIALGLFVVTRALDRETKVVARDEQRALEKEGMHITKNETPAKQGSIFAKT